MRAALIAGILSLVLAGNAAAHGLDASHTDSRRELRQVDIAATVNAVADDGGLPTIWCGTQRTTDNTANATFARSLPQFKLVYAYAGSTNRFEQWRNALQADVSLIGRFMGSQSGGTKAPRFDMGTDCGPQYADIMVVQLPGTRADWVDDFGGIADAVHDRLGSTGGKRNVVVLADQLSSAPAGHWYGIGSYYGNQQPGSANPNNRGGVASMLFVPQGELPSNPARGWWPEGMLHEMTHNLGAVQDGAPHSTFDPQRPDETGGHCWDGHDVMCYDDDFDPDTFPLTYECDRIPGIMQETYDCGNDDYFNVAPATGSYLASHWNTYNNVFLSTCIGVAPACGGSTTGTAVKPEATAPPEVFGSPTVGVSLTALNGQWSHSPVAYGYQWERGGAGWSDIAGATGPNYVPALEDLGRPLRIRVTATNGDGSTDAHSAATFPVTRSADPGTTPTSGGSGGGGGGASTTPTVPGTSKPPVTAPAARKPSGRASLKVLVGRGKGKRLGTIGFTVARGKLKSTRTRIRLGKGRYEVALCTTADASATIPRCAKKRVTVKASKVKLPALAVRMADGVEGRVSYSVTAVGRLFAARTAKRPRQGIILRG